MADAPGDRFDVLLNPTQRATFDELLSIGADRPYAPAGVVESLRSRIEAGTADALRHWTEPNLWLSKAQLFASLRCETAFVDSRREQRTGSVMFPAVAVGLVAHRAIQLTHTHPSVPIEDVVRHAVTGARADAKFAEFWDAADPSMQSDLIVSAVSKTMGFLDSWPALHPTWSPRFEEPLQAKVGRLTLSGRVDLLLGRPRPDGKQTMVITDWKTGALKDDEHFDEASFYALVATLRFGVPPFRSAIFSLASGAWTAPDVDADRLHSAADKVVAAVNAIVDTLTERRLPTLGAGRWCSWCPLSASCPATAAQLAAS